MSLQLQESTGDNVVVVQATGKLTDADYQIFSPRMDEFIRQHGKIRLMFQMHDFHGWKPGAMLEDFKFGRKHGHDMERLAVVGEKKWHRWSTKLCRLFTDAQVRYFDQSHAEDAMSWLKAA